MRRVVFRPLQSPLQIAGGAFTLVSPVAPSSATAPSPSYPLNWALLADPGQTLDSSQTAQYLAQYSASIGGVQATLLAGGACSSLETSGLPLPRLSRLSSSYSLPADFTYADNNADNQTYWDSWATMFQPVLGHSMCVFTPETGTYRCCCSEHSPLPATLRAG